MKLKWVSDDYQWGLIECIVDYFLECGKTYYRTLKAGMNIINSYYI